MYGALFGSKVPTGITQAVAIPGIPKFIKSFLDSSLEDVVKTPKVYIAISEKN